MKENKNENVCESNFDGRFSGELCWEIFQQFTSEGPMNFFWRIIQQIHLGGLSNKFYRNSVVSFREQKAFVLKTVFLLAFGLGMCEGVGEDSRHGIGHVDIQIGSCIYLSVIVCHDMCT